MLLMKFNQQSLSGYQVEIKPKLFDPNEVSQLADLNGPEQ